MCRRTRRTPHPLSAPHPLSRPPSPLCHALRRASCPLHPVSVQLTQFAEIIEMENPDLYCWLTGQQDVPDDISNPLLRTLCAPSLPTPL